MAMTNTVIMALNDYNALKRKADMIDNLVTVERWGTLLEVKLNVDTIVKEVIYDKILGLEEAGELKAGEYTMRSPKEWYISGHVGELQKEEEPPVEFDLDE